LKNSIFDNVRINESEKMAPNKIAINIDSEDYFPETSNKIDNA